jgi:cellulose synthase/poly-beta-1,6-N-acetylglucosamine synthase-like glycosyltransferase
MLRRVVLAFLLGKLAVLLANLRWFPVLRSGSPVEPGDRVSLLVPMRDEAGRLPQYLPSLAAQAGIAELLVLDDCSSDGSAELAARLLAGAPHARVIAGEPVPPGWVGKNWACHQLAQHATGSLLIFCDADVLLERGALGAVVRQLRRQRAEVFSVFPRQLTGSLGERLVAPLVDDVLLCFLPFGLLSTDVPAAATASGALLAFTRDGYRRLGGFAAVRAEIVEDVALARLARAGGLRLGLALGGPLVRTRMYSGYPELVRGFGRGVLPVLRGSRSALVAAAGWHLLAYTVPAVLAANRPGWRLPLLLGLLERALVQLKANPRRTWEAVLTPLCPVAFLPVLAQSLRPRQAWKGRSYPAARR